MERVPVLVIGAGPAGAAAAIELASEGVEVVMVDKATFPRDKCCGDGLTTGALRQLDALGVRPAGIRSWIAVHDVRIFRPSGAAMHFPLPAGPGMFAAVAERRHLDAALVERACEAGVDVRTGAGVTDVEVFDDHVTVGFDDGPPLAADWCIAADGVWSPTRKALGLAEPGYRGEWHAFRQYWSGVSEPASRDLFVWFEPDILPGYAWSFPLTGGRANVGFGVLRGAFPIGDMGATWTDLLARPHIREILGPDAEPEGPHRAWPIPARVGDLPLSGHRVFFVGDAAAACDPLTGEGIGQALQTGRAAARAIVGGRSPSAAAADYERGIDRELAIDMRFAAGLGRVLRTRAGAEWSLRIAGMTPWTRRNFARWLFEDYPRAMLGTPRRWHPDLFRQPGAFVDPPRGTESHGVKPSDTASLAK